MSKSLLTRLSLVLLICLCVFGALPAMAEDTTAVQPAVTEPAVTPAAEAAAAPAAPATVPTPDWMVTGSPCPPNNSFCRFAWNASTGCCVATYTAPHAYCGPYCR